MAMAIMNLILNYDNCYGEHLPNYLEVVKIIREICKIFRENLRKNDEFLQAEVRKDLDKKLKLILDCMTRWYSLADMIRRFLRIQRQIKRTLYSMEVYFDSTNDDLKTVEELSNSLEPLKSAASMVCQKIATIKDSERIMEMTISEMQCSKSQINKQQLDAIYDRLKS